MSFSSCWRCHWLCLLLWLALLEPALAQPAGPAPAKPERLTRAEEKQLAQFRTLNDRLAPLLRAGKRVEAIAVVKEMLPLVGSLTGANSDQVLGAMDLLARLHELGDDFAAAQVTRQQRLALLQARYGPEHFHVGNARRELAHLEVLKGLTAEQRGRLREADRLHNQALQADQRRQWDQAIQANQKALAIRQELLGKRHPSSILTQSNLAQAYIGKGDLSRGETLQKEVVEMREAVLGKDHPDLAATLTKLGMFYAQHGRFREAEPVLSRAWDIWQAQQLAVRNIFCGRNLAEVCFVLGAYKKAEMVFQQVLELHRQGKTEGSAEHALCLTRLGMVYSQLGRNREAEPVLSRAWDIWQAQPLPARNLGCGRHLGRVCYLQGNYDRARTVFEQVLELHRQGKTEGSAECGQCLTDLADMHVTLKELATAERLALRAQEIVRKTLGTEHADYGRVLLALSKVYQSMGDLAQAEPLLLQAARIFEKKSPANYAVVLDQLGRLYNDLGKTEQASKLLGEAIRVEEQLPIQKPRELAMHLNNLATVYQRTGQYAEAANLLQRSLALQEKVLGPDHPILDTPRENLALLHFRLGNPEQARTILTQTVAHRRGKRKKGSPGSADFLGDLAVVELALKQPDEAQAHIHEALALIHDHLRDSVLIQSERQQLLMARGYGMFLSICLSVPPSPSRDQASRTYQEVLKWKGQVFLRQRGLRLARSDADPRSADLLRQLQDTVRQLSSLTLAPSADQTRAEWERQIQVLTDRRERLEHDLNQFSLPAVPERTPAQIQSALPPGTALIDFLQYEHFTCDPKRPWEPHLAAFVVRPGLPGPAGRGPIVQLDLGPVQPITAAIQQWRAAFAGGEPVGSASSRDPAAELRRRVWEPLQPHLSGCKALFVSPDGVLTRFPLAALPGQSAGTFLLEEMPLVVVPVPQMLPELLGKDRPSGSREKENPQSLLVVGAVDFDAAPAAPQPGYALRTEPLPAGLLVALRGSRSLRFEPLPGAAREIELIRSSFRQAYPDGQAEQLSGSAATVSALIRQTSGKRYLHLATHGFFAPPQVRSALAGPNLVPETLAKNILGSAVPATGTSLSGWHPGLLSGLALAGANRGSAKSGGGEGIMTSLVVSSLDLQPTDLVVLSACETGLGDIEGGEGVFGLQRAFQVSGAKTVVASLWKVDDQATQKLMSRFYHNLWHKGLGRMEALRQAQLSILYESSDSSSVRGVGAVQATRSDQPATRAHPGLWAGWVLSGDPGDLSTAAPAVPPQTAALDQLADPLLGGGWQPYVYLGVVPVVLALLVLVWRRRPAEASRVSG